MLTSLFIAGLRLRLPLLQDTAISARLRFLLKNRLMQVINGGTLRFVRKFLLGVPAIIEDAATGVVILPSILC